MSDEKKPDPVEPKQGDDPKGQPNLVAQDKDSDGLVAKNKELLGELKTVKKKLAEFESLSDKEKESKLKEEGKLKELLDKKEVEVKAVRERIKRAELKAAARKYDLLDDEYIEVLQKKIEFDENDQPTNLDEVFKELQEKKPYLFKREVSLPPGTVNNGSAGWKPNHNFTEREVLAMTPEERAKHWPEIMEKMSEGKIK